MRRESFRDRLVAGITLLDGGMGTALMARGLSAGTPPDAWNLEHPDVVSEIHRGYVEAGAEGVHTNTFGANPIRLASFGRQADCVTINRAAVALARAAAPRFVIGDVGPTGELLPPVGKGDPVRWRSAFDRQAKALVDAGVDALHVETMSDLREARLALEVLLVIACGLPVLVSMTFERKKRGFFTVMGDPLVAALGTLAADGAAAVGANCVAGSDVMTILVDEALPEVHAPLAAQPNAGNPCVSADGSLGYAQRPEDFAGDMSAVAKRGVRFVGGCCGTDARFIAALRQRLGDGGHA